MFRGFGEVAEDFTNRLCIGDESITNKLKIFYTAPGGVLVTDAAGISHKNGNITEVGSVPDGWIDPYLRRNSHNDKRIDAAIAERHIQPRAFESGHGDFIKNAFA